MVFEIAEAAPERLAPALARVEGEAARLRDRFPGIALAIVSHGREQFALLAENAGRNAEVQARSRALIDAGAEISVCGTHAERRGRHPEDFLPGIDVAAEGPARIRDLEALGYVRVRVRP